MTYIHTAPTLLTITIISKKMLDLLFGIYYCEIIIDNGVLIFVGCVVHLKHENKNPTKPRTQEPMDQWTFQKPRKLVPINKVFSQ
jgi:hypothetical protein